VLRREKELRFGGEKKSGETLHLRGKEEREPPRFESLRRRLEKAMSGGERGLGGKRRNMGRGTDPGSKGKSAVEKR